MLIKIYAENPSEREMAKIVAALENDGVVILPTDSVYAFGCSIRSPKALECLSRIKGKGASTFSVVFVGLSQVAEYCRVDNAAFRILKRNLPGAFTFILPAASSIPDKALGRRRTIGVRIPANAILRAVIEALGCPILVTSVRDDDECEEYTTDAELIDERYGAEVTLVVDGGVGAATPTTVIDLTDGDPVVLREGCGKLA